MLILTRKCRESVVVGDGNIIERLLRVTVLEISNGKVKLGFEAAADCPIHRCEVWERIHPSDRSKRPASNGTALA
jgi:carbon storage regulator CsrA